ATVGQTLSVDNGTWTGSPTSYAYAWKADGVAIDGATAATYELTDEEIGAVITCTVTATNAGGSTAATSEGTAEVEANDGETGAALIAAPLEFTQVVNTTGNISATNSNLGGATPKGAIFF